MDTKSNDGSFEYFVNESGRKISVKKYNVRRTVNEEGQEVEVKLPTEIYKQITKFNSGWDKITEKAFQGDKSIRKPKTKSTSDEADKDVIKK